ncbi:MAG: hypothetical protein KGJ57_17585 [Sphingomonadales bacterium]|nr:hypothetical protein [Sphingomonadales bacterium]MDE2171211.1 hypothetical protein [Sphingomonadales bacterium]
MPSIGTIAAAVGLTLAILGVLAKLGRVFEEEFKAVTWLVSGVAKPLFPYCMGAAIGFYTQTLPVSYRLGLAGFVVVGMGLTVIATVLDAVVKYNGRKANAEDKSDRKGDVGK